MGKCFNQLEFNNEEHPVGVQLEVQMLMTL